MNIHKLKHRLCLLVLCIALLASGCAQTSEETTSSSEVSEPVQSVSDTNNPNQLHEYSDYELDASYDENNCAVITLSGSGASSNGTGVSISGSVVTITKEGSYLISGTLDDGQIVVDADKTDSVQLILDGASISCSNSSAILVRQADKVKVTLASGSQNSLSDAETYLSGDEDNPDAALFSKDDLIINGDGQLNITGNYKHGIAGNDDLVITGGTFEITFKSHALRGKDSVVISSGNFTLTSEKDGIQASNTEDSTKGWVQIDGGDFLIVSDGDGIQAETDLVINDGNFTITSGGGSENGPEHTSNMMGGRGMGGAMSRPDMSQTDMTRPDGSSAPPEAPSNENGTPPEIPSDTDSAPAELTIGESTDTSQFPAFDPDDFDDASIDDTENTVSTKGIKASNSITINGGNFTIDSADDSLHSNYEININEGSFQIQTGDDGMHADAYLNISGGTIDITESYEGLEAVIIDISGGTIQLVASDDGVNAAGGNDFEMTEDGLVLKSTDETTASDPSQQTAPDTSAPQENTTSESTSQTTQEKTFNRGGGMMAEENTQLTISGGSLTVNADGDGLDSNGNITISGGNVIVLGPTSGADSALDYDGDASISAGTLAALGGVGMAQSIDSSSDQAVLMVTWDQTQSAGTRLTLCDQNGQIIFSLLPDKDYQTAVISTDSMTASQTLTLYTGGTTNSESQLITMGELSDGTKLCDVTLQEGLTSISQDGSERTQSFGGGGFKGGGGGRKDFAANPPSQNNEEAPTQENTTESEAQASSQNS